MIKSMRSGGHDDKLIIGGKGAPKKNLNKKKY
jgi:hypothetical protein